MARQVELPTQALDKLPEHAIDKLPENITPPEPNIIRDDPAIHTESLFGTDNPDIFVFDVQQFIDGNNLPADYTTIFGFDPAEDQIALVNMQGGFFDVHGSQVNVGGDPNIADTEITFSAASITFVDHITVIDNPTRPPINFYNDDPYAFDVSPTIDANAWHVDWFFYA
jgi:hypothetical protein